MDQLKQVLSDNNLDDVKIVTSVDEHLNIPDAWEQIVAAVSIKEKQTILNQYWQPVADHLPLTMQLINNALDDVIVVYHNGEYKLVYIFNSNEFPSVYVGHLPAQEGSFIEHMPDDIAAFYKQVHDGWYENISGGLGFLPNDQINWLSSHEWGILDDIPAPSFDLSKVFYVFHNAGPGYLCVDVTDRTNPQYLIFWTDQAPKQGVEFWSFMDAWIEIGLTN